MQVVITGKNIDVGDSLKSYIDEHFSQKIGKKYSDFVLTSAITLSKESHKHEELYKIDIIITAKPKVGGEVLKGSSTGDTAYKAFDNAIVKVESQLHKHKNKVTSHHHKHSNKESSSFISR
ncbi:MAG: ribosome-associated translation inhibitor RaiA [Rickettsiales endosymbiont of Dermacentor nuttalli]